MDQIEKRLTECFFSVLPDLTPEEVSGASPASVAGWDSVATVTLITAVEEEFGISIEIEDPAQFNSFQGALSYLRNRDRRKSTTGDLV
jgi:acyl carrier protein